MTNSPEKDERTIATSGDRVMQLETDFVVKICYIQSSKLMTNEKGTVYIAAAGVAGLVICAADDDLLR